VRALGDAGRDEFSAGILVQIARTHEDAREKIKEILAQKPNDSQNRYPNRGR